MLLLLLLLATLLVATAVYCLLYVCEYGVLLLDTHIPERLAAACYLLWSFLTKCKTSRNVTFLTKMWHNANISLNVAFFRNDPHATSTALDDD